MTEWEVERKKIQIKEIIAAGILLIILIWGIICDICVKHGIVFLSVNNIESVSITVLQIQATVTTLSITIITLLAGNISESYMGISISRFFLEIRPFYLKQKYIISGEFVLILCGVGAHLFNWYNLVFSFGAISLGAIVVSIFEIYEVFNGKRNTNTKIESFVKYAFNNEKDYMLYGEAFLNDWKEKALDQSVEDFEHYSSLFFDLIQRILNNEKSIDDINSLSENIARFLLEHYSENCKMKGLTFVEDYYSNIWIWINNNSSSALQLDKSISLMERVAREWFSSLKFFDAEIIEEAVNIERLSESIVRVASWIGYSSESQNYDVLTINNLARKLGGYINRQKAKGNLISNKYWENIFCDKYGYSAFNIPEHAKSFYLESLAKRDFDICYGFLLSGNIDYVVNGIFLDGISETYSIDSEEFVFKILLIHCYMYYLAFCETEECIDASLQTQVKRALESKAVIAAMQNFVYRLSENNSIFGDDFEVKFESYIEHYELFPKHSTGKSVIIDAIAREYFLYLVLLLERYSFKKDIVSRLLNTSRYSHYLSSISFSSLRTRMLNINHIFDADDESSDVDDMLSVFVEVMSEKYKKSVMEEAAVSQREYEKNAIQDCVEAKVKEEFETKILDIYDPSKSNKIRKKKYNKICILNIMAPTRWIQDERRDTYADYAIGNFTSWLISILKSEYDFEVINRNDVFETDLDFREYLSKNEYSVLLGSGFAFGCTEYDMHDEHMDFIKSQTCKNVKTCSWSVALKKDILFVDFNKVKVDVLSPELSDVDVKKNDDNEYYNYSTLQGISLNFEEKEMREYLHDEQKIIRVFVDVEIGLKNDNKDNGVVIVRK